MTDALNLLIGLVMGLNLVALASSRITSVISWIALQGLALGLMPLLIEGHHTWLVWPVAVATVALKGFLIPSLLRRAMRTVHIDREVRPLLGYVPSLLLGAATTIGAVALGAMMPLLPEHAHVLLAGGSFATASCGLLLMIVRSKAITQACGYLMLENGIYLFGLLLIGSTPLLVEAGILLDLTVAVFVIGIIVDRIQQEFDSLDTSVLTTLRE